MLDFLRKAIPFLRKPEKQQTVLLLGEDRTVRLLKLDIHSGYMRDKENRAAWFLVHKMQLPMQGVRGLVQIISERAAFPLNPYVKMSKEEVKKVTSTAEIAENALDEAISTSALQGKKNLAAQAMITLALMFGVCFVIVILVMLFRSGTISL